MKRVALLDNAINELMIQSLSIAIMRKCNKVTVTFKRL